MHYTWANVPRLTGVDRFAGLTTLQHRKIALQQIGSIEARSISAARSDGVV
jgi:hypothetical protein